MSVATHEDVHRIWDQLSDFEASQPERAAIHLITVLCEFGQAWKATWGGAIRISGDCENDPLQEQWK